MINTQQSCLSMLSFEDMASYIIQLQQKLSILLNSYIQSNRVHDFLKLWFCNHYSTKKRGEYEYVRSLVYGQEMNQICESFMTSDKSAKMIDSQIVVLKPTDDDYFRYSSKKEAMINLQSNLFGSTQLMNPTKKGKKRQRMIG